MKEIFGIFLISTVLYIFSLKSYILKKKLPKNSWLLIIPLLLLTAGTGYLSWLQFDYNRNMEAIENYFHLNCRGFVMEQFEEPIKVQACGNTYLVNADKGKIVMLDIINENTD